MGRRIKTSLLTGILLLCFILACRHLVKLADFYALHLYPAISGTLSFIASSVPFSLMEITVVVAAVFLIGIPIWGVVKKAGFKRWFLYEVNILLWIYVWFYMAWGINYYRSNIFARAEVRPAEVQEEVFMRFLNDYTERLNESFCENKSADTVSLENHVKHYYDNVDKKFGLSPSRSYQHPKRMLFSKLQRAVSVSGYIGPAFDEAHVVHKIPDVQYAHTYAHEYSHVLGISNEAEANYWAYKACISSDRQSDRYSGYFSLLGHVSRNARNILSEEDYDAWVGSIRTEVLEDYRMTQEYWEGQRSELFDSIQTKIYNWFLKANGISSGIKNYSEVILILMTLDYEC